jgi:integrase
MGRSRSKTKMPGVTRLADGRYRVRAYMTDPKTGRERELDRVISAANVAEAGSIRDALRRELLSGRADAKRERIKLAAYASSWLQSKLPTLKASTQKTYAEILDLHVIPVLGDYFVDAITYDDLVRWRDSQRGAVASINSRVRVLKTVLRDAVVDVRLNRDPTMRLTSLREKRHEVDDDDLAASLSAAELHRLLTAVQRRDPQWYPLVLTLALTGLRFGEATALKWSDIDEQARSVRVRRSQWNGIIDHPKTSASRRTVALAPELAAVLAAHRREIVSRQVPGLHTGYVFLSRVGRLLYSSCLTKPVRRALAAAGIERAFHAAHGFRHTFNNLVRQVAEGEVVRSLTGHVDEEMTSHYSHVSLDEKHAAVARVVELLAR